MRSVSLKNSVAFARRRGIAPWRDFGAYSGIWQREAFAQIDNFQKDINILTPAALSVYHPNCDPPITIALFLSYPFLPPLLLRRTAFHPNLSIPNLYSPYAATTLNPIGNGFWLRIARGTLLPASTRLASSAISTP